MSRVESLQLVLKGAAKAAPRNCARDDYRTLISTVKAAGAAKELSPQRKLWVDGPMFNTSPGRGVRAVAHSYSNLLTHIIFSTKGRAPLIDERIKSDLFAYMGGIVRELGGCALLINGTKDHVHILLRLPATVSLAECVRIVKANSSRWVHEKWPTFKEFGWQIGYGAFAVSASNVADVEGYIRSQPEHHEKLSFRDEFVAFLRKNGIEFDRRFVVD